MVGYDENSETVLGAQDLPFCFRTNTLLFGPILTNTLEAVEYDFGVQLGHYAGEQVWSPNRKSEFVRCHQSRVTCLEKQRQGHHHTFSRKLYLWSMGKNGES